MKKMQLKVEFNEEKMKAIKVSLKGKNKDFDEEILKFLNGLYKKNVPKSLKDYIEIDLEPEERTEEKKSQEKNIKKITRKNNEEVINTEKITKADSEENKGFVQNKRLDNNRYKK